MNFFVIYLVFFLSYLDCSKTKPLVNSAFTKFVISFFVCISGHMLLLPMKVGEDEFIIARSGSCA